MIINLFAYIDPGSSFGIAQVLTALAGAFFVYKVKIKEKIKAIASRLKRKSERAKSTEQL